MIRAVLFLVCLAAPAWADGDDHDRARDALEAGEILPLTAILQAAEDTRPGRVISVELDQKRGRWRYELELISPEGRLYEVKIDAATGQVLEIEREDD
ncbi:PepSY domain-containing protein [Mesobacterium sp. TK19101]|uniref:PepSY domain-containing protein n=1 Tax=Mesobacterium hydrothermale TaxID=3111907 RepID=A0ABU6HH65_9RHOB|nr:PepSY domain-containing protein [Mesobacterium sp. TK19101]MEC3861799.1 PepSY domain-containing protein [Mesobacterium sp. TK19101]